MGLRGVQNAGRELGREDSRELQTQPGKVFRHSVPARGLKFSERLKAQQRYGN
jgi:hypothetical protein